MCRRIVAALPLALLPLAVAGPSPAQSVERSPVVTRIVSAPGALTRSGVRPVAFGLGQGGFVDGPPARSATDKASTAIANGEVWTRGGARIRVKTEGVKIDLPNGSELLIDRNAAIHLRDGSHTKRAPRGVVLWLVDGTLVECVPQSGRDRPLARVRVQVGQDEMPWSLWMNGRATTGRARGARLEGRGLAVLGDGRSLYELASFGPVVAAERVLTPKPTRVVLEEGEEAVEEEVIPDRAIIVLADLMRMSVARLSKHIRRTAANEPHLIRRADALASGLPRMLVEPRQRDDSLGKEWSLSLSDQVHLTVEVESGGPLHLDLWTADGAPLARWSMTTRTFLHLIERDEQGRNHYATRGLELTRRETDLLPLQSASTSARARARGWLMHVSRR